MHNIEIIGTHITTKAKIKSASVICDTSIGNALLNVLHFKGIAFLSLIQTLLVRSILRLVTTIFLT